MVWIQNQKRIYVKAEGSTLTDRIADSASKFAATLKSSCERFKKLYGKRADDLIESLERKECNRVREKSCCSNNKESRYSDN